MVEAMMRSFHPRNIGRTEANIQIAMAYARAGRWAFIACNSRARKMIARRLRDLGAATNIRKNGVEIMWPK